MGEVLGVVALWVPTSEGQEEGDGDSVHLLRHPHYERGTAGGEVDGATTGGSRIVGRLKRFRNGVLARELLDGVRKTTRNPGDEARTKRKNDIKRRVGCSSKQGMAPDRPKLKTLNDNP